MTHETAMHVTFPSGNRARACAYLVVCSCGWQGDTYADGRTADAAEKRHREATAPRTPAAVPGDPEPRSRRGSTPWGGPGATVVIAGHEVSLWDARMIGSYLADLYRRDGPPMLLRHRTPAAVRDVAPRARASRAVAVFAPSDPVSGERHGRAGHGTSGAVTVPDSP